MKKGIRNLFFLTAIMLAIFSCSTKKDTFINRGMHELVSKYNILYNGNIAFNEAKKQLDDTYEDNYWERLPIEPLKIDEDIPMPGQTATKSPIVQGFEKAEEKAVKSIQKHSMLIDNHERNNQIDEAYLLLGKARYYMQRFVPAHEAFTYAIENYPDASLYYETKIWKAKTNIRIQNEERALRTLKTITRNFELPEEIIEQAHTAMAMAYTQLDSTQRVIDHLKLATYSFEEPVQSSRNLFILGQIYRERGDIDSSNMAFETLLYHKKVPHKYRIHAQLERAKNYRDKDSTEAIIFALKELVKERENKPYFDELYYQAGLIALQRDSVRMAQRFFEESVRNNTSKPYQKSLAYEQLGNLFFDHAEYAFAGAYYDSVLQIKSIDQNTKRIRRVERVNKSLEEVIYYEDQLKRNDSILYIASLEPKAQEAYFQEYITEIKKRDELKKIMEENMNSSSGNEMLNNNVSSKSNNEGQFYFYNVQIVSFGLQEFKNRYGNRPLQDNWIISLKPLDNSGTAGKQKTEIVEKSKKYDVGYYISSIPTDPKSLDSIALLRNDAYYNLGLLYKEQFKEYERAAENFEKYLSFGPNPNLIAPVKYHLFRIYEHLDKVKSNKYKEDIVKEYPDSRYALMIRNPEKVLNDENKENSPEYIYKNAYVCFEEGDYDYALLSLKEIRQDYKGLPIEAKIELLKAFILLKTTGIEAGKKQLDYVMINFPNTEESDYAQEAMKKLEEMNNPKKTK